MQKVLIKPQVRKGRWNKGKLLALGGLGMKMRVVAALRDLAGTFSGVLEQEVFRDGLGQPVQARRVQHCRHPRREKESERERKRGGEGGSERDRARASASLHRGYVAPRTLRSTNEAFMLPVSSFKLHSPLKAQSPSLKSRPNLPTWLG